MTSISRISGLSRQQLVAIALILPAIMPFAPTVDIFSDLNAAVQIYRSGYYYSLAAVALILVCSWRFLMVFVRPPVSRMS